MYLPGAGWIGLDPTSGLMAGEGHIPLAATPESSSAAPISGAVDQCEVTFTHEMSVTRIHEDPRVTLPYTDAQWQSIQALGSRIDQDICAGDMRLTMGGEPTFVSIDNMDGAEWNIAALGAEKRKLAEQLAGSSAETLCPRRAVALRAGQMVSGRAAAALGSDLLLACGRSSAVARPLVAGSGKTRRATSARWKPEHFSETLARRLGLDPGYVIPAFEDAFYYLQKERQLPVNVDPVDSQSAGRGERERLRKVFERGLDTPVGFVLPMQRVRRSERPRVADRPVDAARQTNCY